MKAWSSNDNDNDNENVAKKIPQLVADNNDDEEEEEDPNNASAAGLIRGVLRSIGRSAARLPSVGRLPIQRPNLPVKQIAKLSDRLSIGLDIYDSASESKLGSTNTSNRWRALSRTIQFASTLLKNTLLGLAVFETYCYTVETLADTITISDQNNNSKDPYDRASIGMHMIAGGLGGVAHGVAGTVWETAAAVISKPPSNATTTTNATALSSWNAKPLLVFPKVTLYHGISHAVLFASHEGMKRCLWRVVQDWDSYLESTAMTTRVEYLACVSLAGGLAGQAQHVASHFLEQLLLEEAGTITNFRPGLRPTLMAFLPTSVAFVAFEYGRSELYLHDNDND